MPRRPRLHIADACYHVTLRGNHRQPLFRHPADRSTLNNIVAEQLPKFGARLHAYCRMTNHLHLLVQIGDTPLGRPMQRISARYARWFQSTLPTTGHLFERRYHALLIDTDSYLLEAVRYIHLNPTRARLVQDPEQYPWSSHGVYLGGRREPWVTTDWVLGKLSRDLTNARLAFGDFVRQGLHSDTGDDEFLKRLAAADSPSGSRQSLDEWIASRCRAFALQPEQLAAPGRDRRLSRIRAVIAQEAVAQRFATLADVARRFKRDESTLRECVRRLGPANQ